MPYIYKITNQVNKKIYIGKTLETIEERWRHHKNDAKRFTVHGEKNKHRPLYSAINKYGIENFTIEMVEECDINILNDREKFWIEYFQSFKNGYNATVGGDGRPYLDYNLICKTYNINKNMSETARILHIDRDSVKRALVNSGISLDEIKNNSKLVMAKSVGQFDKDTDELIAVFPSIAEAERAVPTGRNIGRVCNGKRKTAGGYKWKFI